MQYMFRQKYKEFASNFTRIGLIICKEELYIFVNLEYKVFVLFYINNI
jgi:hypothetical protein